jgi:hypothetical protein
MSAMLPQEKDKPYHTDTPALAEKEQKKGC